MSLTADDFAEFVGSDTDEGEDGNEEGDDRPLGDALSELAIDVDLDAVEAARDLRETI